MQHVDQLINARWVLPIAPINTTLDHHSLVINDGRIVALLPTTEAQTRYRAEQQVDLPNHAVMPGLVNAHAHTPMNLFRGLADDLELMEWLNNHIWPAEKAIINADSVADGTRLAIAEMLRGGTTCFNDMYFFPDVIATTAIEAGMRACVGLVVMSVPTDWASTEAEYFEKALATLDNGPKNDLIHWTIAPHAPYTVSDDSFKQIKQLADERDLRIHMHIHETKTEVEDSETQLNQRPLARLEQLGLLSSRLIAIHMTQLSDDEISLIKDKGVHVVHCPESNLKLASGFAPVTQLQQAGVNVAIGTDGAASNNDLDLFGELKTAAYLAKAVSGNPTTMRAAQALEMATLCGAKALGLDQEIGSIEAGKAADIIAVDLSSYLTQPIYDPMSHLAYAMNRLQVSDVWVAGNRLLHSGAFTQLDIEQIVAKACEWAEKARPFQVQNNVATPAQDTLQI